MAVDKRHLRIVREFQALAANRLVPLPMCPRDLSVRLFEIDEEDEVFYRCTYCRSRYYPSEKEYQDMERDIEQYSG